jgi:uncharacterized protein (TIGR02145 family)
MKPTVLTFGGVRLTASNGKALFRHGTTTIGGRAYKTILIGNQEWLAENLQLDDGESGIYTGQSSPYASEHFYTWDAAVRVSATAGDGWHLPSNTEFETLFTSAGGSSTAGNALKSMSLWNNSGNGIDAYGFSALPAGQRHPSEDFCDDGNVACFWSSIDNSTTSYYMELSVADNASLANISKDYGFSVRLVRNA